jgi:hypothetical protein
MHTASAPASRTKRARPARPGALPVHLQCGSLCARDPTRGLAAAAPPRRAGQVRTRPGALRATAARPRGGAGSRSPTCFPRVVSTKGTPLPTRTARQGGQPPSSRGQGLF